MDDAWLKRLKLRPEGSAFAHYAHVLRLLSGLNDVGLIRAMVKAKKRQGEEARERELRTDPNVLAFQRFLPRGLGNQKFLVQPVLGFAIISMS